jgi:hypothetical protein
LYKYEYYEETSNEENKTEVFIDDSNYTDNDTIATFRKATITGIVIAIRVSWLDFLLFFWIITLIMDEIQQVKFEFHLYVHLIYFYSLVSVQI